MIRRCWQEWVDNSKFQHHDGSGRPRASTEREERAIVWSAITVPDSSLSTIKCAFHTRMSTTTSYRLLIEQNLRSYSDCYATCHSRVHTVEPDYSGAWLTQVWMMLTSDESHFQLCPDDHRSCGWRRTGKRGDPAFTIARHTDPQQGIMVWVAISCDSRTPLVVIRGTLTAQRYVDDILKPVLLPFLLQCPLLVFQQDNARPHTARVAMNCLQAFQSLPWPARSPVSLSSSMSEIWWEGEFWWPRSTIGANLTGNTSGDHQGALSVYSTPCGSLYLG